MGGQGFRFPAEIPVQFRMAGHHFAPQGLQKSLPEHRPAIAGIQGHPKPAGLNRPGGEHTQYRILVGRKGFGSRHHRRDLVQGQFRGVQLPAAGFQGLPIGGREEKPLVIEKL